MRSSRTRQPRRTRGKPPPTFGATVAIDTREQAPFTFEDIMADSRDNGDGGVALTIPTVRATLRTGDYSLLGHNSRIVVERKSQADFVGVVISSRARFERELQRLADLAACGASCHVVVEADWAMLRECPSPHSAITFKTVHRSAMSWTMRWPAVVWWFCPGRRFCEVTTFRILEMWWRKHVAKVRERRRNKS